MTPITAGSLFKWHYGDDVLRVHLEPALVEHHRSLVLQVTCAPGCAAMLLTGKAIFYDAIWQCDESQ